MSAYASAPGGGGIEAFGIRTVVIPAARPGAESVERVLDDRDARGFDRQAARCLEEDVRLRLAVGDLVGRDDGAERPGGPSSRGPRR
jgi:hypothetical protein